MAWPGSCLGVAAPREIFATGAQKHATVAVVPDVRALHLPCTVRCPSRLISYPSDGACRASTAMYTLPMQSFNHQRFLAEAVTALNTTDACTAEVGNHSGAHECSSCGGDICVIMGIIIHVVGSIGINIGQNLQAMGFGQVVDLTKPWKSKLWVIGMAIFIGSSIFTFGALALAPASLLVPLESVQFIVNIIFNRVVNKKTITPKMVLGVVLVISGIALFVGFGPNEGECFAEPALRCFWTYGAWWAYLIISFSVAAVSYVVWRRYAAARTQNRPLPYQGIVEPVAFTLSAALFGGGQMIVHTKLLAELFELTFVGPFDPYNGFIDWFFYMELVLTCTFGVYWLGRLSQCLSFYDPLFIIPLMQTAFIIFGAVAGGIFFQEFQKMQGVHSYILCACACITPKPCVYLPPDPHARPTSAQIAAASSCLSWDCASSRRVCHLQTSTCLRRGRSRRRLAATARR